MCANSETAIYTGTAMLNTLLNSDGLKTGLIVTRGFEDIIVQGRGRQTFIGLDRPEITHMQYRKHAPPLVPRKLTRGVTERIDMFAKPVIPIYEHEVRQAVRELLEENIESLAIVFLYSFINPAHEPRAHAIAQEIFREAARNVYLALSSVVAPVQREMPVTRSLRQRMPFTWPPYVPYSHDPCMRQKPRIRDCWVPGHHL